MPYWPVHPDALNFRFLDGDVIACPKTGLFRPSERALELLLLVQRARDWYKAPIWISSFARTPLHNTAVGGVKNSQHILYPYRPQDARAAVDMLPERKSPKPKPRATQQDAIRTLATWAWQQPEVTAMGIFEDFLHLDNRPLKRRKTRILWGDDHELIHLLTTSKQFSSRLADAR